MVKDLLSQIMHLLDELDESDLEQFDVDVNSRHDVRNIRSGTPGRKRSTSSRRKNNDKSGKEKFEAKRKAKRLRRLCKKADRQDIDIGKGFQEKPLVRKYDTEDGVEITATRSDAELEFLNDSVVGISFERISYTEEFDLEFEDPGVEKTVNQGVTVFSLTS